MGVACRQICRPQAAGTFAKLSCPDERRGMQASLATEPTIAGQCRFMRTRPSEMNEGPRSPDAAPHASAAKCTVGAGAIWFLPLFSLATKRAQRDLTDGG